METFYMHHYLCIVQCVDEKKKIRCTLLNINAKERNAKIKKNNNISHLLLFYLLNTDKFYMFYALVSDISKIFPAVPPKSVYSE